MTQTRTPVRHPAGTRMPLHLRPRGSVKLTGRGAVVVLFAVCLLGLLIADWTGWSAVGDALFLMNCGVVACYTKASGLRNVLVSPPLAFLGGAACAELITAPDTFSAATGVLITLGTSAPWLFTGTGLTLVIAISRGYRPDLSALAAMPVFASLADAIRDARPGRGRRGRRGRRG
jgi:hypothetical protein